MENLELAGGLSLLNDAYDGKIHWQALEQRWLQVTWEKRAYETNRTLASLVCDNTFAPGLVLHASLTMTMTMTMLEKSKSRKSKI